VTSYPLCEICDKPVTCRQGRYHYACIGQCQSCYRRPAAGPVSDTPNFCGLCADNNAEAVQFDTKVQKIVAAMKSRGAHTIADLFPAPVANAGGDEVA